MEGLNTVVDARSTGPLLTGTSPTPPDEGTGAEWDRASRVYRAGSRGISTLPMDLAESENESPRPRPSPESSWEPSDAREAEGEGAEMREERSSCRPLSLVKLEPGSMPSSNRTRRSAEVLRARNEDGRRRLDCDMGRVGSGSRIRLPVSKGAEEARLLD